jgi:hypothetical protein
MKQITIIFLIMSQGDIDFLTAFNKANVRGSLTLIEGTETKNPRNFIGSMTFCGMLVDCLNLVHYLGGVGVRGVVESVKDGNTQISVANIDRDLITDKTH